MLEPMDQLSLASIAVMYYIMRTDRWGWNTKYMTPLSLHPIPVQYIFWWASILTGWFALILFALLYGTNNET